MKIDTIEFKTEQRLLGSAKKCFSPVDPGDSRISIDYDRRERLFRLSKPGVKPFFVPMENVAWFRLNEGEELAAKSGDAPAKRQ